MPPVAAETWHEKNVKNKMEFVVFDKYSDLAGLLFYTVCLFHALVIFCQLTSTVWCCRKISESRSFTQKHGICFTMNTGVCVVNFEIHLMWISGEFSIDYTVKCCGEFYGEIHGEISGEISAKFTVKFMVKFTVKNIVSTSSARCGEIYGEIYGEFS